MQRIAFIKTGWAIDYEGEEVVGRHAHVRDYKESHERFNFKKASDGRYYGYVPAIGETQSCPKPANPDDWLLIAVSARDGNGPLTVVGFYENATFESDYVARPEYEEGDFAHDVHGNEFAYCFSASKATRIPLHLRQTTISGAHFKRSSIIYVQGTGKPEVWRKQMAALALRIIANKPEAEGKAPGFNFPDAAHRKAVELAAVAHATRVFKKDYKIVDCQADNCGYDLLFVHKRTQDELHVEVKGTSGSVMRFFMSRNEERYITNPRWRLFMVTDALSKPIGALMDLKEVKSTFDLVPFAWEGVAKP